MAYSYAAQQAPDNSDPYLKPTNFVASRFSEQQDDYAPLAASPYSEFELQQLDDKDSKLKHRIRQLRVVSRVLAVILSAAVIVPLSWTLVKFLETRNEYFTVDGERRTAWASGTNTTFFYVYFGVAVVSFLLESIILIAYCRGVRQANRAAMISGIWSGIIIAGHIVIWGLAVAVYRYGKEPGGDGKFTDLWGWTCSTAAEQIQPAITNIKFSRACTIQVSSSRFANHS